MLIEDASCSLGAKVTNRFASTFVGTIGDYGIFGFDKGSIITGYGGAMLVVDDLYSYHKAKYWAEGSYAPRLWPQHNELGYDYRMNGFSAAMIHSQMGHIDEHIAKKKAIYDHYKESVNEDVIVMIWYGEDIEPNYCYSCMLSDCDIIFNEMKSERDYIYPKIELFYTRSFIDRTCFSRTS